MDANLQPTGRKPADMARQALKSYLSCKHRLVSDAPTTRRINPTAVSPAENAEETYARLTGLINEEIAFNFMDAFAPYGNVEAAAIDGSLADGRIWPSSDLDLTLVLEKGSEIAVEWSVRAGLSVHRHLHTWSLLEYLSCEFPASLIITLDPNAGPWHGHGFSLINGLTVLSPVHDPEGRLERFASFMREHRFCSDVVEPRRSILLSRTECRIAQARYERETEDVVRNAIHDSWHDLYIVWMEASQIIGNRKEMDIDIQTAEAAFSTPGLYTLFVEAAGLDQNVQAASQQISRSAYAMFEYYSSWIENILDNSPNNRRQIENNLRRLVHLRHSLWANSLAPGRGCWIFVAETSRYLTDEAQRVSQIMGADGLMFINLVSEFQSNLLVTLPLARVSALAGLIRVTSNRLLQCP